MDRPAFGMVPIQAVIQYFQSGNQDFSGILIGLDQAVILFIGHNLVFPHFNVVHIPE